MSNPLLQTVQELVSSISNVVDQDDVPTHVVDKVQNLVNGIIEYLNSFKEHEPPLQQCRWISVIEDNFTIQLPKVVCDSLGWEPGDTLAWKLNSDGTVSVRKMDK